MKKVVILGSTGSVGASALRVIARHRDLFKVVGLTANNNAELLARQAAVFKVPFLALGNIRQYNKLKRALRRRVKVLMGPEGISEAARAKGADLVIVAISGTPGLIPLMSAVKAKKRIALANKESIVSAGKIVMDTARSAGAEIIPIDSEHNSIFQCVKAEDKNAIDKIFLMGSGGPLKDIPKTIFDTLKLSRILAHPVWRMGKKISVDSATMMNKGLEVIEASHLFGIGASAIEVLFHREAIIHSMVAFKDGNMMANLFYPDMRLPIFYALNYPRRMPSRLPKIDLSKFKAISLQKPDRDKFPALGLCYLAAKKGGAYPAVLNGANEEAVGLYLKGRIKFTKIVSVIKKVLSRHKNISAPSIDEILRVDRWAKEEVKRLVSLRALTR